MKMRCRRRSRLAAEPRATTRPANNNCRPAVCLDGRQESALSIFHGSLEQLCQLFFARRPPFDRCIVRRPVLCRRRLSSVGFEPMAARTGKASDFERPSGDLFWPPNRSAPSISFGAKQVAFNRLADLQTATNGGAARQSPPASPAAISRQAPRGAPLARCANKQVREPLLGTGARPEVVAAKPVGSGAVASRSANSFAARSAAVAIGGALQN